MRTCLAISVAIHAVVMLWLMLAPSARTLDAASVEPIMVDLLPPQDVPPEAKPEPPKSEETKTQDTKPEEPKSEPQAAQRKPEPPKGDPNKTDPPKPGRQADQKPTPKNEPKNEFQTPQDSAEERAATAARLAWMMNLPIESSVSLAGPPSEDKANLTSEQIAAFKAQVSKCWVAPAGTPGTPETNVLMRVALNPNGSLGAVPALIEGPTDVDYGFLLRDNAKLALQKCQPYRGLPADKYRDWKILELRFTATGPAGLSGPTAGKGAASR
jgi:outer membrane biosynthesis protein TonB